jgi:16S rRNA C967 or C1407 C5-methylase (RsmB/RsmF family)
VVIGNDISLPRLKITKNLINKYQQNPRIYLVNRDARELPIRVNLQNFIKSENNHIFKIKNVDKEINEELHIQIDKILVDVECSHDGSLKHMLKYLQSSKPKSKKKKSDNEPIMIISNREKKRRAKQAQMNSKSN